MADYLPYKTEYAKSDRSSCQFCKTKIAKESLRLAAVVKSPAFDGVVPKWYHYSCFFAKQRPKAVGDIENFENLKWDDQEKIREKVASISGGVVNGDAASGPSKKASKRGAAKGGKKPGAGKKLFQCDLAKSNRSTCRGCHESIIKGELRVAKLDQESDEGRRYGGVQLWHHADCFIKLRSDLEFWDEASTIDGYGSLDQDSQKKLSDSLPEMKPVGVKNEVDGASAPKKNKVESVDEKVKMSSKKQVEHMEDTKSGGGKKLFVCDLAKSNRSTCRGCHESIIKGELRVAKKDYESDEGRRYGGVPLWHHADCFIKLRSDLEFWDEASTIDGYNSLDEDSQKKLSDGLPQMKPAGVKDEVDGASAPKKIKAEPVDEKEKMALKKQVERLEKYTKMLKTMTRGQISQIMEHNDEPVLIQSSNIERIADAMAFGWPKDCEKCKTGKLKYKSLEGAYKCRGNLTEWVQCDNVVREPKRRQFSVPPELEEYFSDIKYKPKIGKRIIRVEERSVVLNPGPSTSSEPKIKCERVLPLRNMEFVILGKTETPKEELKREIMKMGGKVTTKIHKKLAAVISNQGEVDKMNNRMLDVEEANIQVVPESFLRESKAGNAIDLITSMNLASWGSDAKKRLEGIQSVVKSGSFGKSNFERSGKSSKVKLTVKGGSAVDPESGMQDVAHVYTKDKDVYSAVLSLTDVVKGSNKYYRIQVLESDKMNKYWVFRAWGRIGTTIGGVKLSNMESLQEAIKLFTTKYLDETGNHWDQRHNFRKIPHKMVPMDLDMGVDESDGARLNLNSELESKLPKAVHDLVAMLFNVDTMKKVMLEFELDLEKMPLGKISKKQIQLAYSVLSELQKFLETEDNKLVVIDATNRFYTLIPHDFGIKQPPMLDNMDIIKSKLEMLESLLEMEIAYSMMKSSPGFEGDAAAHPVDLQYQKMGAEIEPLARDTEEFAILEKYVKNTHAATHSHYSLTVEEIFKVKRPVEEKRYKPFRKLHNKKLLWHGSRLTNFAGILSQGLRIAPPEAPTTGYMFGKGVYFADMVSKSANYCMTSPTNNTGLMLLCEVALGDMYERTQAEYVQKLPPGKHSCKGVGATWPDPDEKHVLDDGVEIPYGKPTSKMQRDHTSLLYNEYIVYDVAQVKARYLFRMKFHYNF